jgi:two-component system phosphate regulon sensor histidine kinase PhoR
MSDKLFFWVPAILHFCGFLIGVGLCWYFFGAMPALILTLCAVAIMVYFQHLYLYTLHRWLKNPDEQRLPNGSGVWTDLFARLYRLHRDEVKHGADLAEWLARFRQAMSLLPSGVVIMDDVLFLEWCNVAAEQHLGLNLARDQSMRVTNLIRQPAFTDYLILGRYEQPLTLNVHGRKLVMQIIPFENRRQILVTHDVTELERIDEMRRDFIANASHELRTPLTVINGFLEIAQEQPDLDPSTRMAHIKLMAEQGLRMQNLIRDMLTLTRLESREYAVRRELIKMQPLCASILAEAQAISQGQHTITLSISAPDLHGGPEEIHSALSNLAANAVRYTPAGGTIELRWERCDFGAQFVVQDNGIGIAKADIARLTERFYRVDKGRSRDMHGTGLGLAIVRHVLMRHRGKLHIDSVLDEGSRFIAQFPKEILLEDFVPTQH